MINRGRLAETFKFLVEIDSVSKEEGDISGRIKNILGAMGAEILVDNAGEKVGGNTGNLIARFGGNRKAPPLMICAHMDTVEPGRGVKAVLKDGVFKSDGSTILGSDDKSGIAIMIETMRALQENDLEFGPIELVFTICEEIGLLGVKNLDYDLISSEYGYVLDAKDTEGIVTRSPAANSIQFKVHGKDAHAGSAPEKGVNAISLAAKAIADLKLGRIDYETTCNIGIIKGGIATNIIPNLVTIEGEARSHDEEKLDTVTNEITSAFENVVDDYMKASSDEPVPRLEVTIEKEFPRTFIPSDHPVVTLAMKAASNLGRKLTLKASGGAADANIFFEKGIITAVLGTGMTDVHTVRESVKLDDLVKTARLLLEIIKLHSKA